MLFAMVFRAVGNVAFSREVCPACECVSDLALECPPGPGEAAVHFGLLQVGPGPLPSSPAAIPSAGPCVRAEVGPVLTGWAGTRPQPSVGTGGRNRAVVTSAGAERLCSWQVALPTGPHRAGRRLRHRIRRHLCWFRFRHAEREALLWASILMLVWAGPPHHFSPGFDVNRPSAGADVCLSWAP